MSDFKFLPSLHVQIMADNADKRDQILEDARLNPDFDLFTKEMFDADVLKFDEDKLKKYIIPRLIIKKRGFGKDTVVYNVDFKHCKEGGKEQTCTR